MLTTKIPMTLSHHLFLLVITFGKSSRQHPAAVLVECCFQNLFNTIFLCGFHLAFSPYVLLIQEVQPYSSTNMATAWKNSYFA